MIRLALYPAVSVLTCGLWALIRRPARRHNARAAANARGRLAQWGAALDGLPEDELAGEDHALTLSAEDAIEYAHDLLRLRLAVTDVEDFLVLCEVES